MKNEIKKIDFIGNIEIAMVSGKTAKCFKNLYDEDSMRYYSVEEFYKRIEKTIFINQLLLRYNSFSFEDLKNIIIGLGKAHVLHRIVENGVDKYNFWGIKANGLLDIDRYKLGD